MNKPISIILVMFTLPCFAADIEGAFGITLGEIFDLEIINEIDIDANKHDLLTNHRVNAPINVEPFKKIRVDVGNISNSIIGIKGSGDIDSADEEESD